MKRAAAIGVRFALGVVLLALAATARGTALEERAGRRVDAFVAAREFQGSVLIARHDTVLFERAAGFSSEMLPPLGLRYGIGLLGRTFTAAAVQRLEMRGRLRLEDSLTRFIPGFPHGDSITIEQLLRHRSGVHDFADDPEFPRLRRQLTTSAQIATWLAGKPPDFAPGTLAAPSMSNYALLARVVEVASGQPYDRFVRDELLDSLGLARTGPLAAAGADPTLAPGFDPGPLPGGAQLPVAIDPGWLVGNGSLASTTHDLLRWTRAVLHDGFIDRRVRTHPYGWGLRVRAPLRTIEQGGRVAAGYAAKIVYVMGADVTVIVLANLQSDAVSRLADDLVLIASGEELPPAPAPHPVRLTSAQLAPLAGRYGTDPHFPLTVRTGVDGAWLAGPDGDFLPLDAESPTHFRFRVADTPVDFDRDSTGRVTQLRWNVNGRAPRLP